MTELEILKEAMSEYEVFTAPDGMKGVQMTEPPTPEEVLKYLNDHGYCIRETTRGSRYE